MIKFSVDVVKWLSKIPRSDLMDVVLNCNPEGLRVQQYDDLRYQWLNIFLSKKDASILEYDVKKNIVLPIQNIDMLNKILKSFEGDFELIPEETQAIFKSSSKEVKYQLIDPKMIANAGAEPPKIKHEFTSEVPLELLRKVLSDIINVSANTAEFAHNKNKLLITIEGCNHKIIEKRSTDEKYDINVRIPTKTLADVISKLTEEKIVLGFTDGSGSMMIKEKTETMRMENILSAIDEKE